MLTLFGSETTMGNGNGSVKPTPVRVMADPFVTLMVICVTGTKVSTGSAQALLPVPATASWMVTQLVHCPTAVAARSREIVHVPPPAKLPPVQLTVAGGPALVVGAGTQVLTRLRFEAKPSPAGSVSTK